MTGPAIWMSARASRGTSVHSRMLLKKAHGTGSSPTLVSATLRSRSDHCSITSTSGAVDS
jgi:hypothetical protein